VNQAELKKILKPLIKECVQEIILKEGLLSSIVSEVAKGIGGQLVVESKKPQQAQLSRPVPSDEDRERALKEHKRKLLDAIGKDSFRGVNVFEGTTPNIPEPISEGSPSSPLSGQDPNDPGVDISSIVAMGGKAWKQLLK
jgi:hypothetical protein